MKKILSYAVAAILLGTVIMLAPVMLLKFNYYGPGAMLSARARGYGEFVPRVPSMYCPEAEALDRGDALGRAVSPSNLLSAGLMLIPSFLLALGVSLYLKKRIF